MVSKTNRGFTLIELLVVIAIIGTLSAIVLVSLNVARGRSQDTAIKQNLANIRARAGLFYLENGFFDADSTATTLSIGDCSAARTANTLYADSVIREQITAAASASGVALTASSVGCAVGTGANSWAVAIPLRQTPTQSWCVDAQGASKQVTPAGTDRGFQDLDASASTNYACKNS